MEDVADVLSKNERLTLLRLLKKLGKHAAKLASKPIPLFTVFKRVAGKRLVYRPLIGTTDAPPPVGIARATKGDVTPAGEKFCKILRQTSIKRKRGQSLNFTSSERTVRC